MVILLTIGESAFAASVKLYVAKNGKDSWSGLLSCPNADGSDGPFATLERAKRKILKLKGTGDFKEGATVFVRQGYYQLEKTFVLNSVDSGTRESPIVYRPYENEKVILSGGKLIRDFKQLQGSIIQYDLKNLPLKKGGIKQLFCDGERQIIARWPNKKIGDIHGGQWTYIAGIVSEGEKDRFEYQGNRPAHWKHPKDCQLSIYPSHNWYHTVCNFESFDIGKKIVKLQKPLPYDIKPGRRFYFQNIFEELDMPGEWFYDHRKELLYFWPPRDLKGSKVLVPILDNILCLDNVSHVTIKGFIIEGCNGDAIKIKKGHHNSVVGCTIRNTGGYGIIISGGKENGVLGNDIYDTGKGAIIISGGDRRTLTPAYNYAENNHIYHYGQVLHAFQHGITIRGVGNRISHNLIHDGPDIGIRLYGNDHVIEYNEIYNVCQQLADTGAIYIGRDFTYRGNIIRYNKIHDIYGYGLNTTGSKLDGRYQYETPYQAWGIYLDDCTSGTTVFGNIIYRVPLCGVMVGGGRDNIIKNNIFVNCIPAIFIGARSLNLFKRLEPILNKRLQKMNYMDPPYSIRYPNLASLVEDDRRKPANNHFIRNIVTYSSDNFSGLSSIVLIKNAAIVYYLNEFDQKTTLFQNNFIWHNNLPVRISFRSY